MDVSIDYTIHERMKKKTFFFRRFLDDAATDFANDVFEMDFDFDLNDDVFFFDVHDPNFVNDFANVFSLDPEICVMT